MEFEFENLKKQTLKSKVNQIKDPRLLKFVGQVLFNSAMLTNKKLKKKLQKSLNVFQNQMVINGSIVHACTMLICKQRELTKERSLKIT